MSKSSRHIEPVPKAPRAEDFVATFVVPIPKRGRDGHFSTKLATKAATKVRNRGLWDRLHIGSHVPAGENRLEKQPARGFLSHVQSAFAAPFSVSNSHSGFPSLAKAHNQRKAREYRALRGLRQLRTRCRGREARGVRCVPPPWAQRTVSPALRTSSAIPSPRPSSTVRRTGSCGCRAGQAFFCRPVSPRDESTHLFFLPVIAFSRAGTSRSPRMASPVDRIDPVSPSTRNAHGMESMEYRFAISLSQDLPS